MSVYCFHKLHVVPPPLLKHVIHFAVKMVSPDHASVLRCVLFCLQVLHTNLESSLQAEGPEHELLQQMVNSIRKKNQLSKILNHFNFRIREHKETIGSNPVQHPPPRPRVFFFYIYKYTGIRKITIS